MRYNLHIFFTVKIQKFTPYAPFLPLCFLQNRNTNSKFVDANKIGNQALYKAIC